MQTTQRRNDLVPASTLEQHASLLLPVGEANTSLDPDQFERYATTARILDRMLSGCKGPARVLEVGCNVLNLLPRFLDPGRVRVTRCDVERFSNDPDFVLLQREMPLPFAAEEFDAVVALEVLEHLPAKERRGFVADCLRVARHGAVFTCPAGTPEVVEAEMLADAAFRERHGRPHPFLEEHREFGLPTEEEVVSILRELDVPFMVFDNSPLSGWLAGLLLSEGLVERRASAETWRKLNEVFRRGNTEARSIPYRKVYVCAKSFDATRALDPLPEMTLCDRPVSSVSSLQSLASVAADALCGMDSETAPLLAKLDECRAELEARSAELAEVRARLEVSQAESSSWAQQYLVVNSLWTSVTGSRFWKLLAPLRALRNQLRPRGFDEKALIAWRQLEPVEGKPGSWRALGIDPQFVVPCYLPAGWLRVRLKLTAPGRQRVELYVDSGDGFQPSETLERAEFRDSIELDFFIPCPRPVRAFRLDPVKSQVEFHVESLQVEPVPLTRALRHAFGGKVRLLQSMSLLPRALWNGLKLLVRGDLRSMCDKVLQGLQGPSTVAPVWYDITGNYQRWRKLNALDDAGRERLREAARVMTDPPLISVLMPVCDVEERYLRLAIESVRRQTYPHWELCLADDASTSPHVRKVLEEYARADDRIKVSYLPKREGISAASNTALGLAHGEYIALVDHDDELAEHALSRMAEAIVADRGLDMLYSDEDKLEPDGRHVEPFFKPDWSPEYFLACMYTCHLGVYRTSLVRDLGGFRSEYDFAQDYDLVLRMVALGIRIAHVPDILYHWRKLPSSTASGVGAKSEAPQVARRALTAYLASIGREGTFESAGLPGLHRVRYPINGRPKVSIILASACRPAKVHGRETYYLLPCLHSIRRKSTYDNLEIIVLHAPDADPDVLGQLTRLGAECEAYATPFNWSAVMNRGAARATGDYLLFLNDDTEVITPDWIESMLEHAQHPEIGAVGAKLLFPDGRIQHVGVTILDSTPGHPFYRYPARHAGYFAGNLVHRNFSAVTGACLMTRASVFRESGGFDVNWPLNFNDVDYCLRVGSMGRRIVFTPHAQLYHHEGKTKAGVYGHELEAFKERWGKRYAIDPQYNPNLSQFYHDYRLDLGQGPPPVETGLIEEKAGV